jgi:hypothetical protein
MAKLVLILRTAQKIAKKNVPKSQNSQSLENWKLYCSNQDLSTLQLEGDRLLRESTKCRITKKKEKGCWHRYSCLVVIY